MKIDNYSELEEFVKMFRGKYIDLLVIRGRPGTGKTYTAKEVMDDGDFCYINTHLSPLEAYRLCHKYKDRSILIDDISALINNNNLLSLLKQTGETNRTKTISWHSTTGKLDGCPKEFTTESNLCIIANKLNAHGLDKEALIDRGFVIDFDPTKKETLNRMRSILDSFTDGEEVYEFIEENYDKSARVNLRTLVKGIQLKRYDERKWKTRLMKEMEFNDKAIIIKNLMGEYDTDKERLKHYPYSRRDYYRHKKKLAQGKSTG